MVASSTDCLSRHLGRENVLNNSQEVRNKFLRNVEDQTIAFGYHQLRLHSVLIDCFIRSLQGLRTLINVGDRLWWPYKEGHCLRG